MSHTVYPVSHTTGANGEIVTRESAGGVALDMRTSANAGRNDMVHASIGNSGHGKLVIFATAGVEILVYPNGPGDPLFTYPAADVA